MARKVVLAVDDDFRVRESLGSLLESGGYIAVLFGSGADLLESGMLGDAVCLITDVRLPAIHGIELQRRVRCQRPDLPVIFISAFQDEEIRDRALNGGALHFLYKPYDAAALLGIIDSITDTSSTNKQNQ